MDRKFFVPKKTASSNRLIGGAPSSWSDVISGIPQGSVLGSAVFQLYINDLPNVVKSMVKLFADDKKLYSVVNDQQEAEELQTDLDNILHVVRKMAVEF